MNIPIKMSEKVLAIIGGGRWGCVTLKVLSTMQLQFDRIVIVSKNNAEIVQELVDELQPNCTPSLTVVSDLKSLLSKYKVNAAIVVNAAPEHYATALTLIEHGVHVLIEKPITLTTEHTKSLIKAALVNNVCVFPGLNYRFCEYLKNFAAIVAKQKQKPHAVFLDWANSSNETRYFSKVTYFDTRTDIAQDCMAHVWAIFSTVFNTNTMTVNSAW